MALPTALSDLTGTVDNLSIVPVAIIIDCGPDDIGTLDRLKGDLGQMGSVGREGVVQKSLYIPL